MSDYVVDSFKYGDEEEKFEEFRPTPFLFDSTPASAESSFEVYFTLPGDKAERTYNLFLTNTWTAAIVEMV